MTFAGGKAVFISFISTWLALNSSIYAGQDRQSQLPQSINPSLPVIASNPGEVTLRWTAPGNDGNIGIADHYIIRYSTNPISESNWDSTTNVPNPPVPLPGGSSQSFTFSGLDRGGRYYFAIRTFDAAGNCSGLSNIVRKFAGGIATPSPIMSTVDTSLASVALYADTVAAAMRVKYQFALDLSLLFPNPSLAADSLIDSLASVIFAGLSRGSRYYWRCRAITLDLSDSSLWSAPDSLLIPVVTNDIPIVSVTAPNGGESWEVGSMRNITWTDSDINGIVSFKIEYALDGGGAWLIISDWTSGDPHVYNWTLPDRLSAQALIRVSCRDVLGGVGSDISDGSFAIVDLPPVAMLTSPSGGETWNCESIHDITWSGNDDLGVAAHKLEYSVNDGSTWSLIRDWVDGNPGHYPWSVPNAISQYCRVKVTVRNISGLTGSDFSAADFTISDTIAPRVMVTNPDGGEKLRGGMNRNITWSDGDNIGISSFKLDFSIDGGNSWFLISNWTSGDPGRYSWDVPNTPSANCRVCVSVRDAAGNVGVDISDRDFLIRQGRGTPVSLLIPDSTIHIIYDEDLIVQTPLSPRISEIPGEYSLGQSYPNPFNSVATIDYGLPQESFVRFDIFDISGRHVATLVNGNQSAGYHSLTWDSSPEPSGIYLYRLRAGEFVQTRKMTVIK